MATVFIALAGMSVLVPMAKADAPRKVVSATDGVSYSLAKHIPHRLSERGSVSHFTPGLKCPQWADQILDAGFKAKDLDTVDALIFRESRCLRLAHNKTLNRDGSQDYGLMQINDRSWCKPNRFNPDGYLQKLGVLNTCDDLFIVATNLRAAFMLYQYSGDFSQWLP